MSTVTTKNVPKNSTSNVGFMSVANFSILVKPFVMSIQHLNFLNWKS